MVGEIGPAILCVATSMRELHIPSRLHSSRELVVLANGFREASAKLPWSFPSSGRPPTVDRTSRVVRLWLLAKGTLEQLSNGSVS